MLRSTNPKVPKDKLYYYFISEQDKCLHLIDAESMEIKDKKWCHCDIGVMKDITEYGKERHIVTAGDGNIVRIRAWNSTVISSIVDRQLVWTNHSTSIWYLNWIEGTEFLIISFNDGIAKSKLLLFQKI